MAGRVSHMAIGAAAVLPLLDWNPLVEIDLA